MRCTPTARQVDRARPLLGTLVSIRVRNFSTPDANRLITAAFDAIADIHRLMSFHEPDSDVTRLNRDACRRAVTVDRRTYEVLKRSQELSEMSDGAFDVAVGGQLAAWGYLPAGHLPAAPDARATWRDIELMPRHKVRFRRNLWIDVGGIAKGYAVDAAIDRLRDGGAQQVMVNAGGDLRVAGPEPERILLRLPESQPDGMVPAIELKEAALASSSGREHVRKAGRRRVGPHIHGIRRSPMGLDSFVSVVADRCVIADGLTKIVLAKRARSNAILKASEATAYVHSAREGWRVLGIAK